MSYTRTDLPAKARRSVLGAFLAILGLSGTTRPILAKIASDVVRRRVGTGRADGRRFAIREKALPRGRDQFPVIGHDRQQRLREISEVFHLFAGRLGLEVKFDHL